MNKMMTLRQSVALGALALALTAPGLGQAETPEIEALITAARAEPPLSVYDSTGKITEMADAFAAKYGLQATGTKVKAEAQIEMMLREAQAGNVQGDVSIISDAPSVIGQLLPVGAAVSYLPPDLAPKIPEDFQNPLVVVTTANVWAYNAELASECPVSNIWQLTEPEWNGKVAMQDPLGKSIYTDWFSQMEATADDKVAAAYVAQYGKPLETDQGSATKAWVKAMAQNAPVLGSSDSAAAEAVGAPGQSVAFMGMMSSAKFRENTAKGYKLGLCADIQPFAGFSNAGVGVIAAGTDSPNAARLFIHYVLTAEGIAPQAEDGKISSNSDVALPADEPSGVGKVLDRMLPYRISNAMADWDSRQDWQDFWRLNYRK
ncbi:ABC transporter substrate-binding protein [Phaeovulum sp. W22_SRMD_FR3]|uniref:ABC transporter substrate-binding protein n=1 Tax=Phaeovulum sp. W22_SRMD_FR3 TaxID=3240274 RepID=UPI003F984DCF